ncbi:MAG: SurA N-terminal domain-containing protein [Nitrospirota bacterium]
MRHSKFFTVFLLSAITIMISIAFIFWGIGPKDNATVTYLAEIEDETITLEQFWRAYDIQYQKAREQYSNPEDIEKLDLENQVLSSMVDRTVLLIAAHRAGLKTTESELQEAIMNVPVFQRNGAFNEDIYRNYLRIKRQTPQIFENQLSNDMMVLKMSRLISETSELSAEEFKILESIKGGNKKQLAEIFRSSKSNQTIKAYIESVKKQLDITINSDLIS